MEAYYGDGPSRDDDHNDDKPYSLGKSDRATSTSIIKSAEHLITTNKHYTGNIVSIPDTRGSAEHSYIIVDETQKDKITTYIRNMTQPNFIERQINAGMGRSIITNSRLALGYAISPITTIGGLISLIPGSGFDPDETKALLKTGFTGMAVSGLGFVTMGPFGIALPLLRPLANIAAKLISHPFRNKIKQYFIERKTEKIIDRLNNIAVLNSSATPVPLLSHIYTSDFYKFAKRNGYSLSRWLTLPGVEMQTILQYLPQLSLMDDGIARDNTYRVMDHILETTGSLDELKNMRIDPHHTKKDSYEWDRSNSRKEDFVYIRAACLASYPNMPRDLALDILSKPFTETKFGPQSDLLFDIVKTYRDIARLTNDEIRLVLKDWNFIQLNPMHLEKILLSTPSVQTSTLGLNAKPAEGTSIAVTPEIAQAVHLPPHITQEQIARVRDNLAQLDITSQIAEALTTNSVSAAHKVGEAEINEISLILSTINTDSQSTLNIAKGLIERLTPVSETITRSQKDIELLRDNSIWGMARRAFNRLTIHRFAANATANFNDIDHDVAESRATSISLMERFETLGSLGKLLDEPLKKINDTIETSLQETPASPEVETVLRATQKHALTLYALSQQAQQMVGMLITGESNFATFTRGIGIANVATGLVQTVNDMAEKNRMVTGLTAPMNEQIATSVRLFETRLMEVQAQIAEHQREFEKGAALARTFQNNVLLSLPAPEQDLGNPLDQLTTQPHRVLVGTTRHMILD